MENRQRHEVNAAMASSTFHAPPSRLNPVRVDLGDVASTDLQIAFVTRSEELAEASAYAAQLAQDVAAIDTELNARDAPAPWYDPAQATWQMPSPGANDGTRSRPYRLRPVGTCEAVRRGEVFEPVGNIDGVPSEVVYDATRVRVLVVRGELSAGVAARVSAMGYVASRPGVEASVEMWTLDRAAEARARMRELASAAGPTGLSVA